MANRVVYLNGEFVAESEARVSIFDSALMFGDMAFEMTRTYRQELFRLDEHIDRLYDSLRLLEIDCGLTIEQMKQRSLETLERNLPTESDEFDWQIMHNVSRGPLGVYSPAFPQGIAPTVSINCWPLVSHVGGMAEKILHGVQVAVVAQHAIPNHLLDPRAKTRSRMHYQMAIMQGARMGNVFGVMLDPDGYLAEGPGWNIFLVRDGALLTPEPRNILIGVSRGAIIDIARSLDIEVHECNLGRLEALQADEIFCTSTPFGAVHASHFEGQQVGDGSAGPVYRRLIEAWQEMVGVDFAAEAQSYAAQLPGWLEKESQASAALT
ncbi:MAG: aminotransferase class IV [Pirellulaceae bacterium]|nr:aminotransferase class IV [Pirellulaceae bacterium]